MAIELSNAQRAEVLTQALPHIQKYYGKELSQPKSEERSRSRAV